MVSDIVRQRGGNRGLATDRFNLAGTSQVICLLLFIVMISLTNLTDMPWIYLLQAALQFFLNKRRVPVLRRFAEEKHFYFQEDADPGELDLFDTRFYKNGRVRNIIRGELEGVPFVYFEHVISPAEIESVIAFDIRSDGFSVPKPAPFGFLGDKNNRYGFFWWDGYLVPLNEMDALLRQGLNAFRAATQEKSRSSPR